MSGHLADSDNGREAGGAHDLAYSLANVMWFTIPFFLIVLYFRVCDGPASTMSSFKCRLCLFALLSWFLHEYSVGLYGNLTALLLIVPLICRFCADDPTDTDANANQDTGRAGEDEHDRLYFFALIIWVIYDVGLYGKVTLFFLLLPLVLRVCEDAANPNPVLRGEGPLGRLRGVYVIALVFWFLYDVGVLGYVAVLFLVFLLPLLRFGAGQALKDKVYKALSPLYAEKLLTDQPFIKNVLKMNALARDLAPYAEFERFPHGAEIYKEGASCTGSEGRVYFFWIGGATLVKPSKGDLEYRHLRLYDMFGTEVFLVDPKRRKRKLTAMVVGGAVVFSFHIDDFRKLYDKYPTLQDKMAHLADRQDKVEASFRRT